MARCMKDSEERFADLTMPFTIRYFAVEWKIYSCLFDGSTLRHYARNKLVHTPPTSQYTFAGQGF
jgi:hypothetical protein